MRFLVIGGAGYVGAHFCFEAIRQGHRAMVLDNLSTGHGSHIHPKSPFLHRDCRDKKFLENAIRTWKPDVVLHFAALSLVGESVARPGVYYDNNVVGTLSMLQAIEASGHPCGVVFSSTCAVFGEASGKPLVEGDPRNPTSPYGRSKFACELLLEDMAVAHHRPTIVLRYFNACGADPSGKIGEWHEPETHLIPSLLRAAKAGKKVSIFGNDFDTRDGTCIRDYIHVTDLAEGHLAACARLGKGEVYEAFHLGTGKGTTNLEVLNHVKEVTGVDIPFEFGPRRPGDATELVANPSKATDVLGFKAKQSDMTTVIQSAWDWEHKRSNLVNDQL